MTTGKKIVIGVIALGAAVFLFFKFYGASLVKSGVETYGPEYTGTSVTVSGISFSPLSGNFGFSGLEVGNPPGYQGDKAFRLGEMRVDVDPATVLSDVVRIHDLAIVDPEFAVEIKKGKLNAKTILDQLNRYGSSEEGASETRVQIENVTITGGKVTMAGLPVKTGMEDVALPDIHLTNIGTERADGVSFADASAVVMGAVVEALTKKVAETQAKGLLGGFSDKVKGLFGGDDDDEAAEEGN